MKFVENVVILNTNIKGANYLSHLRPARNQRRNLLVIFEKFLRMVLESVDIVLNKVLRMFEKVL